MIESGPLLAVAPLAGLAAYCGAHVVLARTLVARSPYAALAGGSLAGLVAALIVTGAGLWRAEATVGDAAALVAMNGVATLALSFCYFNFVNLTVASLRIRMLEEILEAPEPLPKATLLGRYDSANVAGLRIERLVRGGHLVEQNGRFRSGRLKFLVVARIFDVLHWTIIGSDGSGEPRETT